MRTAPAWPPVVSVPGKAPPSSAALPASLAEPPAERGLGFPPVPAGFPPILAPLCSRAARPPALRKRNKARCLQCGPRGAGRAPVAPARPCRCAQPPSRASRGCGVGWLEQPSQSPCSSLLCGERSGFSPADLERFHALFPRMLFLGYALRGPGVTGSSCGDTANKRLVLE